MKRFISVAALIVLTSTGHASTPKLGLAELKGLELGMNANAALKIFRNQFPHAVRRDDHQGGPGFFVYEAKNPLRQVMFCRDKVVGLHASENGPVELWEKKITEYIERGATTISEATAMNVRGSTNVYAIQLKYPALQDVTVTLTNIGPTRGTGTFGVGAVLVKEHSCKAQ